MGEEIKKAERIQTSVLNATEKKVLVWLAERQPEWMTSNYLTFIGIFGSLVIFAGYFLSNLNINWLWLASLGFIINWYGDSLDGSLARVRGTGRPIYGYYLDHTVDALNEICMFVGIGLAPFCNIWIAIIALIAYLLLTLNVSMNAHLKQEFKLTYAKLGPTELRIILIILNTVLIFVPGFRAIFNYFAGFICAALVLVYIISVLKDLNEYAHLDPPKKWNK